MALNFPPTPSNGDYDSTGKWQFSSTPSPGVWKAVASSPTVAYPSPTAPANPKSGDLWYNTSNGLVYIYYTDQDTSQWVEIKANSSLGTTLGTRVDALEIKSPNYVINGGMEVAQRGTSFSFSTGGGAQYFGADRFWTHNYNWSSGSNLIVSQDTSVYPAGVGLSASYKIATGTTGLTLGSGGVIHISTTIEGRDISRAYGKVTTLSFWVRSSISGVYNLLLGNGNFEVAGQTRAYQPEFTISQANTWERKSITVDLTTITQSSTWDTGTGYGLQIKWILGAHADRTADTYKSGWTVANGTTFKTTTSVNWATNANATFYVTGVQLEDGPVATTFRRNTSSWQAELSACQRYFEKSFPYEIAPANGPNSTSFATTAGLFGYVSGNSMQAGYLPFLVQKRTSIPTMTAYGNSSGQTRYRDSPTSATDLWSTAAVQFTSTSDRGCLMQQNVVNNVVIPVQGHWTASAEL